ncbi:MAG: DNA double-strand break repair nuclease NurA [Anaerolineales bacterium]|jgi:hypothetical protein
MALNFQQVVEKIRLIGASVQTRQAAQAALRAQARSLLESWANKTAELGAKVERACQIDPGLRCAMPLDEPLDAAQPEPAHKAGVTLIAADGSEIAPDRHAAVFYSLVNVGAIVLQPGSGRAPDVITDSQLLFADELYTQTGMLTEEAVQQRRDIAERRLLLALAPNYPAPVITLTDGPLELWGGKGGEADEYRRNLETYKSILSQLQAREVIVAGFVDKPAADLVVRLLELARMADEELAGLRTTHPLRGVSDRWLFSGLLGPGQRSAVFGLQSGSRTAYAGDLALRFFYLNVGDQAEPALARVEIPKWISDRPDQLNLLHAALLEQCRVMGVKPYPYPLHRAHEAAVVKFAEREQIEQLLALELRRNGGEIETVSGKQAAKDLKGRTGRK